MEVGTRLGSYEILGPLGAGGMGEVYRARDTKLGREVAVKALPEAFSRDPEKLARFQREAHLLASLNHPNIATLYGVEESNGQRVLVMELVEGETLAERLSRGSMRIDEALTLFVHIAEGLEAAHEKGIVHRDLKPSNIKMTPDGRPKILDFGLAKALAGERAVQDLSQSPTLTRDATETGVLLGTAPYMSPEQARGKPVDERTDIWAFGCCLYEALTGRPAFIGETASDTIGKILEREPDWEPLPAAAPATVRRLLRRSLTKDARHRLQHIGDARLELEDASRLPREDDAGTTPNARSRARWTAGLLTFAALAVASVVLLKPRPIPSTRGVSRFAIRPPPNTSVAGHAEPLALSPDGRRVAYVAASTGARGARLLYLQPFDELEPRPIPGSNGAEAPFFSPEGDSVGFFADGKLKRISVDGGAPSTVCDVPDGAEASWGPDDTIYISRTGSTSLLRVSAGGGIPETLVEQRVERGAQGYRSPTVLPGGEWLLLTVVYGGGFEGQNIELLSVVTGERRTLVEGGAHARYSSSGHLVFSRGDSLMAVPFDAGRREILGQPIVVLETTFPKSATGTAAQVFDVSASGTLAYLVTHEASAGTALGWLDRDGTKHPIEIPPGAYFAPSLSPDGRRVALTTQGDLMQTWIFELDRNALSRFTFEGSNHYGVWSPDGQSLVFSSDRGGPHNLYRKRADGAGEAERLTDSDYHEDPGSWSPDGKLFVYTQAHEDTGFDLWLLHVGGERRSAPFLRTVFDEKRPVISPDGRWIAYVSNESGRDEVYVRTFPDGSSKWTISNKGGDQPRWARDGREVFYLEDEQLMAVDAGTEAVFEAGRPRPLFETRVPVGWGFGAPNYDIAKDGGRFLLTERVDNALPNEIRVTLNWFEELKRLVPTEN